MSNYFLITVNEDGDIRISTMLKDKVMSALEDHGLIPDDLLTNLTSTIDPQYWGKSGLLIKGEIVVPKAITKVTEYEVP